ncbi:signal transduction histidine kinase [Caulobacter sp. BE264]|uniref:sensor histidine kinase n=1 Tax=Caulobacter sp. BE264 TaxID=2817724 RepID=UPI002855DFC6|nr:ATP-binding protein [Caulobacter sp. BE264]MDR7230258.1 signal transduction histidine kinase [Caulobacter sp. BE264]
MRVAAMTWHGASLERSGGVKSGVNWRQILALAGAIAAVQLIYWQLIDKPLFNAPLAQAPAFIEVSDVAVARLERATLRDAASARYEPIQLPWTHCCDPAVHSVRAHFRLDKVPETGLGLISTLQVDNYLLAINGTLLVGEGRMQPGNGTFHGQKMFLTRIPAGLLKRGDNQLTYVTLRDGFPYADISPPLIAEYEAMRAFSANRLWSTNEFYRYAAGLMALLGMLSLIMVARAEDWRLPAWLSALCFAFVGNYLYAIQLDPGVDGWARMAGFFLLNMAVPVALLCFIDEWTGRPVRYLKRVALSLFAVAGVYVVWSVYRVPMPDGFDRPAELWSWFLVVMGAAIALRIGWHFARLDETRIAESALLTVCVVAILFDGASRWFPDLGEANLHNSAPFLMLAMLAAFLARNFRLFRSQATLTADLRAKVAEREAELALAHARERELVRQQAHDSERRRIMQDIHDGLGSQLMSMMLAARLGEAEPAAVADGLQAVIDEMRLMVDSMDSVGESLGAALATFRARIQPRIAAAGVVCHWQQAELAESLDHRFGPREVLQIFRIMQEAVTNALRHAGADSIEIAVGVGPDGALLVSVSDNGRGGAGLGSDAGRGLANMQRRAAAVGGALAISSPPGRGTRIALHVPGENSVAADDASLP